MNVYPFGDINIKLAAGDERAVGVSRSGLVLSKILPSLQGLRVLDQGCGNGYISVGALMLGATEVVATDVFDTEKQVRENLRLNGISQKKLKFFRGNLFEAVELDERFDVIIANLPQHALPAIPASKQLAGKNGGHDGTDLVCASLVESAFFLKDEGKYFGSISKLTNYKRTIALAESLFDIKLHLTQVKHLLTDEMEPYIKTVILENHLKTLKNLGLITYKKNADSAIEYEVMFCEFIKKKLLTSDDE